MTRLFFLLIFSLIGTGQLSAQSIVLSPAETATFYNGAYESSEIDGDTLRALLATKLNERDNAGIIHAESWLAFHYSGVSNQQAKQYATQAIARCQKAEGSNCEQYLAPAYQAQSYLGEEDRDKSLVLKRLAMATAPSGCHLQFYILREVTTELAYLCDPEVESYLDKMKTYVDGKSGERHELLLNGDYNYTKALYLETCNSDLEQAEILFRQIMDYYKECALDAPQLYTPLWAYSVLDVAVTNAKMNRPIVVNQLIEQLDTVDVLAVSYSLLNYTNYCTVLTETLEIVGDYDQGIEVLEKLLVISLEREDEQRPPAFRMIYGRLYDFHYALGNFEKARSYLEAHKEYENEFDLVYGKQWARVLYQLGDYQSAIDTANAYLERICLDCTPGQLPDLQNELRPNQLREHYIGILYGTIKKSHYALSSLNNSTQKENLLAALSYADRERHFHLKDYQQNNGSDEGKFHSGQSMQEAFNGSALITAHLAEITGRHKDQVNLFRNLEDAKANDLKSILTVADIPPNLLRKEADMKNEIRAYEVRLAEAPKDKVSDLRKGFIKLSDEYVTFRNQLRVDYEESLDSAYAHRSVSLSELMATLPPNGVFLNYLLAENKQQQVLVIQVITNDMVKSIRVPVNFDVSGSVAELRRLLNSPLQIQAGKRKQFIKLSHQLYNLLIEPFSKLIPENATLMVCADKDLLSLPFELLLKEDTILPYHELPFLLRNHPVNYHFSATSLVSSWERKNGANKIVAFAPVFDKPSVLKKEGTAYRSISDSLIQGLRDGKIDPLPATAKEAEGIISSYPAAYTKAYLRKQATKKNLLLALNERNKILHLATHSYVNETNTDLNALACYDENGEGDLLYANEIKNQAIQTDLVVLSSCESGLGRKVNGEGLLSLNRAFFAAGARNVVSTFWKIDDKYSSDFMIRFHQSVSKGLSYSEALREAKLHFLENEKTAAPRFWAGFVLFGG
jgi:CHAT domain-containing protein